MQIKITVSVGLEHLWRDASWPPLSPRSSSVITPSAFRVRAQRSGNKRGPVCVYVTSTKSKRAGGAFEVDGVVFITDWRELHHRRSETHALNHLFTRLIKLDSFWRLYCKRLSTDSNSCSQSPACWRWNCNHQLWVLPVWGLVKVAEGGLGCDGGWNRVITNKVHYGTIVRANPSWKKQIQRLKLLLGHQNGELLWHSRVLQSGGRLLLWSWSRRCTAWRHRRDFATLQMWQLYVGCSYMAVWLESNKSFILSCFKTSAVPTSCCRCTSVTHLQ